jgi:hypothetical protein
MTGMTYQQIIHAAMRGIGDDARLNEGMVQLIASLHIKPVEKVRADLGLNQWFRRKARRRKFVVYRNEDRDQLIGEVTVESSDLPSPSMRGDIRRLFTAISNPQVEVVELDLRHDAAYHERLERETGRECPDCTQWGNHD